MSLLRKSLLLLACMVCLQGCSPTFLTFVGGGLFASREWIREKVWPQEILDKEKAGPDADKVGDLWCYKTLGSVDCYKEPQDFPPESLVGVNPPEQFPQSRKEHFHALAKSREAKTLENKPDDKAQKAEEKASPSESSKKEPSKEEGEKSMGKAKSQENLEKEEKKDKEETSESVGWPLNLLENLFN